MKLRFGPYETYSETAQLRKHGIRIKLAAQPFQVLLMLAGRPGELVTREEIRLALWPNETAVAWEYGINTAIKRIRAALADSATHPRYVETVPRRGYRFVAPVERIHATPVPAVPTPGRRRWSVGSAIRRLWR